MVSLCRRSLAFVFVLAMPGALFAQATITGVVKDTSGAVLPGVTVEAASPALIERTRSVVTDGTGQYRIEQLRPGTYSVTFTLTGFTTVKREGVELAGTFVATVPADLRVSTVTETITVTGASPVVDVQNTVQQRVLTKEIVDTLPTGKSTYALANLIPGVTVPVGFVGLGQDVGGSVGDTMQTLTVHGSSATDQRMTMDGLPAPNSEGAGQFQSFVPNTAVIQETTIDTSGVSADLPGGGIRFSIVPRDGGNTFHGNAFSTLVRPGMVGNNLSDRVKKLGLTAANTIHHTYDVNAGLGGPLVRDKLWFFGGFRRNAAEQVIAGPGAFYNANAGDPNAWTYAPIKDKPAIFRNPQSSEDIRFTWQVNAKNKVALSYTHQSRCYCPRQSSTISPDAMLVYRWPNVEVRTITWSAPLTNRILAEAGFSHLPDNWAQGIPPSEWASERDWAEIYNRSRLLVGVVEQSNGVTYRNMPGPNWDSRSWIVPSRAAISYITGAHSLKVGFNDSQTNRDRTLLSNNPQDLAFRFNNGRPNQLTMYALPNHIPERSNDFGLYAQDKWTMDRLTLSYGARLDYFHVWFPASHLGPGVNVPTRNIDIPKVDWVSWKDVTPRLGLAYDLRGNGKTALKFAANKYTISQGLQGAYGDGSSPVNLMANTITRSWTDADNDFVPDCDLRNPQGNGECGVMSDVNFGTTTRSLQVDPAIIRGSNVRPYNWEFSGSVQQQVLERMSVTVAYYRRIYGNFNVTDNRAVGPNDFTAFSVVAPTDSRLPDGGGYTVSGLYDLNPDKVGQVNNYFTSASTYGNQYQRWTGVDVSVNLRLAQGILLQGGTDTGRQMTDNCEILAALPESAPLATSTPFCHQALPFLTQVKLLGAYTVPKIDMLVSATFQSIPGPLLSANVVYPNAAITPSLGRPLSGGAANATIGVLSPGAMYGDRLTQLDLRLAKRFTVGPASRVSVNFDAYNLTNSDTVLVESNTYSIWRQPTQILQARYVKLSAQIDF